jgi:tetratricopeptide (TPR) repeat protein
MPSASRTIGLAAAFALASGSAWAGDAISGSYQADGLGRLELSNERERLTGYATEAGACGFSPRQRVLEGEFQGSLLVGRLTLCQRGEACPAEVSVPILAVYSPGERSLAAYVRLQAGCQSPALGRNGLVVLQPAPETPPAARSRPRKRNPLAAKAALEKGNRLMGVKDWSGSAAEFERSIGLDDRNWVAFFGLGTAQLMRGQAREAIEALGRARELEAREPIIDYHLACAHSRLGDKARAMEHLRRAVKLGFALSEGLFQDAELNQLLGSEAEYLALVAQAIDNHKAGRRQPRGL